MITNLVFKRNVHREGATYTELKNVQLDIPEIKKSDNWELIGMFDEVITTSAPVEKSTPKNTISIDKPNETTVDTTTSAPKPDKFKSPIKTQRMMVRTGDCIRVVNRNSDFTTYNAVSLMENEKIEFYKSFRSKNPNPSKATPESIVLRKSDVVTDNGYGTSPYKFWDNFMIKRFLIEQERYMSENKPN